MSGLSDFSIRESLSRSNNTLMIAVMEEMDTHQALKESKVSAADMAVEVPDEPPSSFLGEDEEDAEEEPQVEDPPEDPYPSVESSPETPKTPSSAVDPVLALLHAVKMKMPLSMHMQMFKKKTCMRES